MKIIAFDQSTVCTGWSEWIDGKLVDHGTFKIINPNKYSATEKIEMMYFYAKELITSRNPDFIMMEQPFYGMNQQGYKTSCQLTGVLMVIMFELKLPFELIEPSSWRSKVGIDLSKEVNGKSKRKKQEELKQDAIDLVLELYGVKCSSDEAEGILIGLATSEILKG